MYSRETDGKELTFGVSGKLIRNALVMYDRQTGSLWAQILGQAIQGPLKGAHLEYVPSIHTTWLDWKTRYPETLALKKGYQGNISPYMEYFQSDRSGVLGETFEDSRLGTKQFVIGIEHQREAVAYPFSRLNEQPVVNDQIKGMNVLVVFDAQNAAGVVFERKGPSGETLNFALDHNMILTDRQTGSLWDGLRGEAISGPLQGFELRQVKSTAAFWFGWKDWYPQTRVFGE